MFRIDKDQGPESIKEILSRLFTLRGLGRRQGRLHLEKAWEAAAGLEVSKKTRVLSLKRGLFEVEVNGAILMQELASFQKRKLLEALKVQLPKEKVTDLRFRVGSW